MKLHLGCGKRYLTGFTHVDLDEYDHIDVNTSIDNLSMFESNSVDEIYSSHALEYFDVYEVLDVLNEWNRVLKQGGALRIAVPDFQNLTKVYLETGDIEKVIGPIVGRWPISQDRVIYHKQIFDEKKLSSILTSCGFEDISRWNFEDLLEIDKNYDDHSRAYYPHMDFLKGIHLSLNLICKKS